MIAKRILVTLTTLPLLLILTGCPFMGDCTHNFVYQGIIKTNDNSLNDSLVIHFDNLGDIIFNIQNRQFMDTSFIDNEGRYKVTGDFFTACGSDENIFDRRDSLSFEIINKGQLITKGKFCIKELDKIYTDSSYFTIINLPIIQI